MACNCNSGVIIILLIGLLLMMISYFLDPNISLPSKTVGVNLAPNESTSVDIPILGVIEHFFPCLNLLFELGDSNMFIKELDFRKSSNDLVGAITTQDINSTITVANIGSSEFNSTLGMSWVPSTDLSSIYKIWWTLFLLLLQMALSMVVICCKGKISTNNMGRCCRSYGRRAGLSAA